MRKLLPAIILLITAQTAYAELSPSAPSSYAATLDEENRRFLKELVAKVRNAGFRDAEVVPQIFLVKAKDKSGRALTLLVNSDTAQVIEIGGVQLDLIDTSSGTSLVR
jgi:hypothetical protein